jgi:2-polyprenyl-3-methyl-5-hydroxy-6-metoxy-1,4-benzoquinol methylase
MWLPPELACPAHHESLRLASAAELACPRGCRFPVEEGIPRFVRSSAYASAFGLQWNAYRRTQLDSHTGTAISRDRLARCLGGSLEVVRGKSVLEAGCGAGRFTEVLLAAGARVFAFDLSEAVVANLANCGGREGHFVCQADVLALPAAPRAFDFAVALGMIQHTPSPEATIAALAATLKPGGTLVLDHYRPAHPLARLVAPLTPRSLLRQLLLRLPQRAAFRASQALVRGLLPLHRLLWRRGPLAGGVRAVWRRVSPVFDYYDAHPELGGHLAEWALLDTHDGLTDRYKHLRSVEQIERALRGAGLQVLECRRGGNGVEARARAA